MKIEEAIEAGYKIFEEKIGGKVRENIYDRVAENGLNI